jgi:hypothetical protein
MSSQAQSDRKDRAETVARIVHGIAGRGGIENNGWKAEPGLGRLATNYMQKRGNGEIVVELKYDGFSIYFPGWK